MSVIGKNINKFRLEKGMSINKLAELTEVAPSTIRDWEQGREIRGEPYQKIAMALGVSFSELMGLSSKIALNEVNHITLILAELEKRVKSLRSML